MRIAVAHEWLTNWAGSERVAAEMVALSKASELVVSVADPDLARCRFPDLEVRGLWPSSLPGARRHWPRYAPAMMAAWATTRIRADALLISSHFAAHAATIRFDGPTVVYYHTPSRMLWRPDIELDRLSALPRSVMEHVAIPPLRRWDRAVAQYPTTVVANSHAVAERIRDAYGREADVVHPPVDVREWQRVEREEPRHLLFYGRLVAYKRADLAIEAARQLRMPLVVVGDGAARANLERTAPPNVYFTGHLPIAEVRSLMARASALLFPGEEDFGIAPVEALAAGVPVIAFDAGGARDYVRPGVNGVLVSEQSADAFADAVASHDPQGWDDDALRSSALAFTPEVFRRKFTRVMSAALAGRSAPDPTVDS